MPPLQLPSECGNERRSNGVAAELQRSCHEEAETRRYPTFSFQEKYIRCKYTKKALGNLDITTIFFLDKLPIIYKQLITNIYFRRISTEETRIALKPKGKARELRKISCQIRKPAIVAAEFYTQIILFFLSDCATFTG